MDKALIELLEKKEFAYITVKELCAKAGVNRSTFYLHYETMADLLEETMRYLIDDFLSYFSRAYAVNEEKITNRFQDCPLEDLIFLTGEYIDPYLTYIKENRRIFKVTLNNSIHFGFDEIYNRMRRHIFDPILARFGFPEAERKYVMPFYLNGIYAVIMEWVKEDCKEPQETIRSVIVKCAMGNHRTQ